jgi:hypothetical protein
MVELQLLQMRLLQRLLQMMAGGTMTGHGMLLGLLNMHVLPMHGGQMTKLQIPLLQVSMLLLM